MTKLIRRTFNDMICQFLIDKGKNIVDLINPLTACKLALETIEEHNKNRHIAEVLEGLKYVDTESLKAEKSLERLHKSLQVIAKATTQDKINRFKQLTINGIIYQDEISDNDYELYLNIIDNLTDNEFLILSIINKIYPTIIIDRYAEPTHPIHPYKGEITFSSLDDIIAKFKDDTQIAMSEKDFFEILKEATGLQEEINSYLPILYSKGLVHLEGNHSGNYSGVNEICRISMLGQKFIEFVNK